jgi:hypothetical protein
MERMQREISSPERVVCTGRERVEEARNVGSRIGAGG